MNHRLREALQKLVRSVLRAFAPLSCIDILDLMQKGQLWCANF